MTNKIDKIQMPDGQVLKLNGGGGLELCDIGMAPYVDETKGLRRYLNGQIVDINTNTQAFLNRLLEIKNTNPDYFTTEENWQSEALLNIDGCVYKFVLNYSGDTVVSVRLPKYPDYVEINAGGTLPVVGNSTALGLTNGTDNFGFETVVGANTGHSMVTTGAYGQNIGTASGTSWVSASKVFGVTSDPTKSGIQTTLNQTKLKMRYFIQIATGSETEANIVNTLENVNGFTLLESKYSDKPLYNECWLLSNNQWNPGGVYITAYEGLQVEYNTEIEAGTTVTLPSGVSYTKRGLSVKLSTETYTDYDFVLNTAEETFRLPLLDGSESIVDYSNAQNLGASATFIVPYNGYIRNIVANTSGVQACTVNDIPVIEHCSNSSIYNDADIIFVKKGDVFKSYFTQDASIFYKAVGNGYLYFYVGDLDQNHGIVNMGRIGEQVASLTTVVETYQNGTSWYRVYSDGWCEQGGAGGVATASNTAATLTKTLLKEINPDRPHYVNTSAGYSGGTGWNGPACDLTSSSTVAFTSWVTGTGTVAFKTWEAKGYLL